MRTGAALYDLAIVGGGLGGSALATVMAQAGCRVLVVERERKFRDRNRGEGMHPWGVAEARALGVERRLLETCGSSMRWRNLYERGGLVGRRDMVAAGGYPGMDFHHPEMQEVMLDLARESGAEIRRGVAVTGVEPGEPPSVSLEDGARIAARLVVGADGRTSRVREWAGLPARRDPECLVIAGILYGGLDLSSDAFHVSFDFERGQSTQFFPLPGDRFRCYFYYARHGPPRPLQGARHEPDFVAACVETGAAASWFARAQVLGALAAFEGADRWVEHPYRDGVALIGDAAASSDPCFGCGLSLTLRDVRTLRDRLLAASDWAEAGQAYAEEHARYYGALHRIHDWNRELLFHRGPAAEARRARALPLIDKEPERRPDLLILGPDAPSDEAARRRFYCED